MLPSKKRLDRQQFTDFLKNPDISVVFNRLGTLKYKKSPTLKLSVVTSSKHEKTAVKRNAIRRKIYTQFQQKNPYIIGILYVSKQAYLFTKEELHTFLYDLFTKIQKNTQ